MPEGHTLHRLARLHQRRFAGAPVGVSSPQGRFTDAALVDGRVFRRASAWGKHLFHHYERLARSSTCTSGCTAHSPSGPHPCPPPVGAVRMRIVGADFGTDLRGPTACEVIDEAQVSAILSRLGPDPLRPDADPCAAWARISLSRRAIGALLMDQSVLAGVGNVYRSELLFRHRIDPYRPGRDIDEERVHLGVDGPGRPDESRSAPRPDHRGPRPRTTMGRRPTDRDVRAPTSIAVPESRADCVGRRSAPPRWRAATCSGARLVRSSRLEVEAAEVAATEVPAAEVAATAIASRRHRRPSRRHRRRRRSRRRRRRHPRRPFPGHNPRRSPDRTRIRSRFRSLRRRIRRRHAGEHRVEQQHRADAPRAGDAAPASTTARSTSPPAPAGRRRGRRGSSSGCAARARGTPRSRGPRSATRRSSVTAPAAFCPAMRLQFGSRVHAHRGARGPHVVQALDARSPWPASPAWRWWPARSARTRR